MKSERRRVVVTGLGAVTPLACEVPLLWTKLVSGCSAVGTVRRFDVSEYPSKIAAEIRDFQPQDPRQPPTWLDCERIQQYALSATWDAVRDANLCFERGLANRAGVVLAAGPGTYAHGEFISACSAAMSRAGDFNWSGFLRQGRRALERNLAERLSPGNVAAKIAHRYGLKGPVMAVMTACSAGTQALGDAARWIRAGVCDIVLAGGSDCELYPMGLAYFCLLGALSTRNEDPPGASRPFDAGRDGFVLGEGAGILVLEELGAARARGARIYAEIAGFGSACDAYRVTDPHPEGKGAILAIRRALKDAAVDPREVGYINAHGTSTRLNDPAETLAIKEVFKAAAYRVPISSTKSMIGHLTVAAGAVEAIATTLALHHQQIHPTINYRVPDPDCDLDYVPNHARAVDLEYALSNSFAFGGQCATLLLRRYSD